jgi:hypothetical protein
MLRAAGMLPLLTSLALVFGVQTSCPAAATDAARGHYARGNYAPAISALANVEMCADGSDEELAEAFRWRAQAKAASGDAEGSIEAWALTWTVLPSYMLDPLESPKFHELYGTGRSRAAQRRLVFGRLTRTNGGRVVAQVFDPHRRLQRVMINFNATEMPATHQDDGTWSAPVPEGALSAGVVVESGDAVIFRGQKQMLAELPASFRELTATPSSPPSGPGKRWLIAGGAAAGTIIIGAVITCVVLGSQHVNGSLGRLELP